MSNIHISLDDVKGIFKALTYDSLSSIFDTRTLRFLREMHQLYGTVFYLFCTYRDGDFSLEKVPGNYAEEFRRNADWLKFGFHCYDEGIIYKGKSEADFKRHFSSFQRQIKRIAGQDETINALRIHSFQGDREICRILRAEGVSTLFTADDDRCSYYLDEEAISELKNSGSYYDQSLDLMFVRSCTRLENSVGAMEEIEKYRNAGWDIISIFTHEWQMDRENIRNKFELCCQWKGEKRND